MGSKLETHGHRRRIMIKEYFFLAFHAKANLQKATLELCKLSHHQVQHPAMICFAPTQHAKSSADLPVRHGDHFTSFHYLRHS